MARFYSNENIAVQLVSELRNLGHDVMTSLDAGKANRAVPDAEVLAFAIAEDRILLSHNRRHFIQLHNRATVAHPGIVVCSFDPNYMALAQRIHAGVTAEPGMRNKLLRINLPG